MKFVINGGHKLDGKIKVHSAKNCILALLAASILTDEQIILHDCPKITDVLSMIKILVSLGVRVEWQGDSIVIDSSGINSYEIPATYAREIRSSIFLMGSILGRLKKAKAVFPGGCDIGLRPIDLHLKGLRTLNIAIDEYGGYLYCNGENAHGAEVHLDFPSVGATENLILAAALADGETVIHNVAKEPEIVALQNFLNKMGAKVSGAGSATIRITGVKHLFGTEFKPIPDRIVAGTYLLAGAITGGRLCVAGCIPSDIDALVSKMRGCCGEITVSNDEITISAYPRPLAVKLIETQPFPGFPTDLQAQMLTVQTISVGASMVVENMFETRYKHVSELVKLGADIVVRGRLALVRGVESLYGAEVFANDLRGGAALVLAGLCADGKTVIDNVKQIDRGYFELETALNSCGADVIRVDTQ